LILFDEKNDILIGCGNNREIVFWDGVKMRKIKDLFGHE
jgi:hypothetical protein